MFTIYILLITACLLAVLINRQYFIQYYKYWAGLLGWTLIIELLRHLVGKDYFLLQLDEYFNFNAGDHRRYTYFLGHVHQPVEFTLLVLMYTKKLVSKLLKDHYKKLILSFWIISIFCFFTENPTNFNSYSQLTEDLVITILAIAFAYQLLTKTPDEENLLRNTFFWINSANLFFYAGTFFYVAFHNKLSAMGEDVIRQLRIIMILLNYILYLLYLTGALAPVIRKK